MVSTLLARDKDRSDTQQREMASDPPAESKEAPPPDYNEVVASGSQRSKAGPSSPSSSSQRDEKKTAALAHLTALSSTDTSPRPSSSWIPSLLPLALLRGRSEARLKKGVDDEITRTVIFLIGEIVKDPSPPDTLQLLRTCLNACQSRDISFESLMQMKSIEDHTPLYWLIVKSPSSQHTNYEVIDFFVSFTQSGEAKADARNACLVNSDNVLYQRMRGSVGFTRQSYTEELISRNGERFEHVHVEPLPDHRAGAFRINLRITEWLRKMRMAHHVPLEFIARGRAWSLTFIAVTSEDKRGPTGHWIAELRLLEGSSPAWVDGQLVIRPARTIATSKRKRQQDVVVPFQTKMERLTPSWVMRARINVSNGATLEYEDSPYLHSDGSLNVMGEFRLERPKSECVIC